MSDRFFKQPPLKDMKDHIYVDSESGNIVYSKWVKYTPKIAEEERINNLNTNKQP
jgi:hypothetical protein